MSNTKVYCGDSIFCTLLGFFSSLPSSSLSGKLLVNYLDCLALCRLFPIASLFILKNMQTSICFLNTILLRSMYV